ncbi:vascular endothelial growth factor receptor 2-like [Salarias fasciatus]|uniref:vascular endothelial growth factor receptor 2-like n=1 Tax=Salarias fasciatus TaxID=181472 RepID=UPI001176746D|nr:vascular endothelial growth factor receptor 2-like [Salarias fasciatus]
MFSSNQAALLFFQLLGMHRVFGADVSVQQRRTVEVFRGEPVELNCNISTRNTPQFTWMKDKVLIFSIFSNETLYKLPSPRQIIHQDSFTRLSILDAQAEDEGLYSCSVTRISGVNEIEWNVTVTEKPEEDSWEFLIILTAGFPLCCMMLTVCIYRMRTDDVNDNRTLATVFYHSLQRDEMILTSSNRCCQQEQSQVIYKCKSL